VAKERRSWQWQIVMVLPSSICVEIATPHEIKLAVPALIQMEIPGDRRRWKIERLFARLQKPPQSSSPIGRYAENFASKLDATAIFLQ